MSERIVIICPKGVRTGGPKDLHQLGHALNVNYSYNVVLTDIDATISGRQENLAHPEYSKYSLEWIDSSNITKNDILIFPETHLSYSKEYQHNLKIIWWLSFYNGVSSYNRRFIRRLEHFINSGISYSFFIQVIELGHQMRLRYLKKKMSSDLIHCCQSEYAYLNLKRAGIQSMRLRDFLDDFWLEPRTSYRVKHSNVVLTNGAKNKKIIEHISTDSKFSKYSFELLSGLSQSELESKLMSAFVYTDFGYHPGKDHLPREAAALGLPVILNTRGAAGNPIDYRYNVVCRIQNPLSRKGKKKLLSTLESLTEVESLRIPQVEALSNEKEVFERDLDFLVKKIKETY
jgi:hypothetical protein